MRGGGANLCGIVPVAGSAVPVAGSRTGENSSFRAKNFPEGDRACAESYEWQFPRDKFIRRKGKLRGIVQSAISVWRIQSGRISRIFSPTGADGISGVLFPAFSRAPTLTLVNGAPPDFLAEFDDDRKKHFQGDNAQKAPDLGGLVSNWLIDKIYYGVGVSTHQSEGNSLGPPDKLLFYEVRLLICDFIV